MQVTELMMDNTKVWWCPRDQGCPKLTAEPDQMFNIMMRGLLLNSDMHT